MKKIAMVLSALLLPCVLAAKTDKVDLPFIDDPSVVDRWVSVAYVGGVDEFSPGMENRVELYFPGLELLPGGRTDNPRLTWTRGVILAPESKTASAYSIRDYGGVEHMFMEWKTGDYVLRDQPPGYYVMVRARDHKPAPGKTAPPADDGPREAYDCLNKGARPGICRRPSFSGLRRAPIKSLPAYDPASGKMWQLDLRGTDLSGADVSTRAADLLFADFDSNTRFPEKLPAGFDPERIMARSADPGLGVRALHARGVTGKGVSIGIIDQPLLTTHREYASALRSYEEMHLFGKDRGAAMHGAAVASIAVGKTCGVAPGADLYYVSTDFFAPGHKLDFSYLAAAIDRLLAVSEGLPEGRRIRVISISRGFRKSDNGAGALLEAIERAKRKNVLVLTTSTDSYYDFDLMGLGRDPMSDPEEVSSYAPGLFWEKGFFGGLNLDGTLLVPMDSRTTASHTGDDDYVFYRNGGLSWAVPYAAGLYALACQADPAMTPERFFSISLATSRPLKLTRDGKEYLLKNIVAPAAMIGAAGPEK